MFIWLRFTLPQFASYLSSFQTDPRKKRKNTHFEVRFKDKNSRYKWSNTEMTFSPETEDIISKDKQEDRVLYIQKFKNGDNIELYL